MGMKTIYRPNFDLDALRCFVAVVELQGFTAAADALAKTQSTVSHQIKKLEEQLGRPLLERTTRRVALTPAGAVFFEDARALLEMAEKAETRLHANQISGEVRLGVPEEIASSLLPDVLAEFRREHPNIRVAISVGVSGNLRRAVEGGSLDLALIKQSPAPADALVIQPLCWVGRLSTAETDPLPMAFFPEPCEFRSRAIAALQSAGRAFDVVMTTTSYQSLYAISLRGLALTVVAVSDCPAELFFDPERAARANLPELPSVGYTIRDNGDASAPTKMLGEAIARALIFSFGNRGTSRPSA